MMKWEETVVANFKALSCILLGELVEITTVGFFLIPSLETALQHGVLEREVYLLTRRKLF
jgi:hypothetical protein